MKYSEILKSLIGIPSVNLSIDNSFPLIDSQVNLTANSRWVKTHNYTINDGDSITQDTIPSTIGSSNKSIVVKQQGELKQKVEVENSSGVSSSEKILYSMQAQIDPYFEVEATEIVRVGEPLTIKVIPDNGYSGDSVKVIRIYKENTHDNPVVTYNGSDNTYTHTFQNKQDRGIYDVEVDVTDQLTNTTFSKRINKLVTVTPALASREQAIEYLVPDAKKDGGHQSWIIHGEDYPVGSTIVLKYDPKFGEKYPTRIAFYDFKGTAEQPYIITIDSQEPFEWNWFYWFGLNFANCEHIVFDGRGYNNLDFGFKVIAMPEFANTAIQCSGLCNELEFFGIEIYKADFAGFMIKADPSANQPQYWWPTYKHNNLRIHHCYIHDTTGEGSYLGHYNPNWYEGTNSQGESVRYRAHHLYNPRIYRNIYKHQGYDNFQLNNAENAEICYNVFIDGGYRMEKDQTSALALGLSGKIYNNIIYDHFGPGIQILCMGDVEIFNNIIARGQEVSSALYIGGFLEPPVTSDDKGVTIEHNIVIHNNVLFSYNTLYLFSQANILKNVKIIDNFAVYKGRWGGMSESIMQGWEIAGNVEYIQPYFPFDFSVIDEAYKLGDSENVDLRIASTSPLCDSGNGKLFTFDFNGYKNWFDVVYPTGAYLGKYKSPLILDAKFGLAYITINDGAQSTLSNTVKVFMKHKGDVTHYRISEDQNFQSVEWKEWKGEEVEYQFNSTGVKTLYCQIKSDIEQSQIKSATINYLDSPLELQSITIEDGATQKYGTTVSVKVFYTGSSMPTHYRAGEQSDLSDATWKPYSNTFSYQFSNTGNKTLYVQLKDSIDSVTSIKSDSIEILTPRNAVVSLGWSNTELQSQGSIYDDSLQLNKIAYGVQQRKFLWNSKEEAGSIYKMDNVAANEDTQQLGYITGDNSAIYPDEIIKRCIRYNGFPQNTYGYRRVGLNLNPGNYKLKLFMSLNQNQKDGSKFLKIQTIIDDEVRDFVIPEDYTFIGNTDTWLEQDVSITESKTLELRFGFENVTIGWVPAPLNIIKIEEL